MGKEKRKEKENLQKRSGEKIETLIQFLEKRGEMNYSIAFSTDRILEYAAANLRE